MLISDRVVMQLIETPDPKENLVAIIDQATGDEVEINRDEWDRLVYAVLFFHRNMTMGMPDSYSDEASSHEA